MAIIDEYQKEVERIKRLIRFHELRGFKFSNDVIPNRPKKITSKHIEDLRKIDYHYVESKGKKPIKIPQPQETIRLPRQKHPQDDIKKGRHHTQISSGNPQNLNRSGNLKNLIKGGKKGRIVARQTGVTTKPFIEKHISKLNQQSKAKKKTQNLPKRTHRMHNIMITNFRKTLRQYANAVGAVYVENLLDRLIAHFDEETVAEVIADIGNGVSYETFYDYTANNKFMNEILDKITDIAGSLRVHKEYLENLREAVNNIDDFGDYALAQENKYVRAFSYTGFVDTTKQELARQKYRESGITGEAISMGYSQKQIERYIKAVESGLIIDTNYTGDINSVSKNWGLSLDKLDKSNPNWELK